MFETSYDGSFAALGRSLVSPHSSPSRCQSCLQHVSQLQCQWWGRAARTGASVLGQLKLALQTGWNWIKPAKKWRTSILSDASQFGQETLLDWIVEIARGVTVHGRTMQSGVNTISRSPAATDTLSTVSSDFTMIYAHLRLTRHGHTSAHRSQSLVARHGDTRVQVVCMQFVANI